ncbi:MAG: LacI family DNA-binding transcriptional regulator, partial [Christensenellaceae bacterium]
VSKALNDATDIAEDTKRKILEYAVSVGYKPKQPYRRICVLFETTGVDDDGNVLTDIFRAFTLSARKQNYEVVCDYVSTHDADFDLNEYLQDNYFCAAFLLGINFQSRLFRQIPDTKVPLVLLDNHVPNHPLVSSVSCENTNAIQSAVFYLHNLGHTRIGFLSGELNSYVTAERFAGYILGTAICGLEYSNDYIYHGDFTKRSGEQSAEFFAKSDVTAVICCSDLMAIGLIDGLHKLGVSVPGDVSVIGFDDTSWLKYTSHPLTTIRQDFARMGEAALGEINDMLSGRQSHRAVLGYTLVERNSVKSLK